MSKSPIRAPPVSREIANLEPRKKSFVTHAICAAVMINSYLGLKNLSFGEYVSPQYGGFAQFLTIDGIGVMIIGAASDLLPGLPIIRFFKRVLLLIAMPVELVISAIYWPIILLMPQLMLPPKPDAATGPEPTSGAAEALFFIPLWMDLSMHALPAAILLFDFMFLEKKFKKPMSNIGAPLLAISFGAAYCIWVEHCAKMNGGKFPYPFLTIMDLPGRITMYTCSTLFALFVFWGLNRVHR